MRLAGLLGCTLAELVRRVSWREWCLWQAWYVIEPWGESRADLRQTVGLAYQLAPYLSAGQELPAVTWPYYEDAEPLDPVALQAAADEERKRWADWEASRPRTFQ